MEIQTRNGYKTRLEPGQPTLLGRESGLHTGDRSVSRRHVSLTLHRDYDRVGFEVVGKNPIWVCENGEVGVYRMGEKGVLESGDSVCVSSRQPVWFEVKKIEAEGELTRGSEGELTRSLESGEAWFEELGMESDAGIISDPVKEFGFVVMGHEFDCYSNKMIRDPKKWNWFLEEPGAESTDDDDDERKKKRGARKKRKKGQGNGGDDDDDWTGESEEDSELITKIRKVQKATYSTRSKDPKKHKDDRRANNYSRRKDTTEEVEDEEDDDEDDTLGGFIVSDEVLQDEEKEEETSDVDEEEEEEFDDDLDEED